MNATLGCAVVEIQFALNRGPSLGIIYRSVSRTALNQIEGPPWPSLPYSCCDSDCDCDCESPVDVHSNFGSVGLFPNLISLLNVSAS